MDSTIFWNLMQYNLVEIIDSACCLFAQIILNPKVEAVQSSTSLLNLYQTAQLNIPEDSSTLQILVHLQNLISWFYLTWMLLMSTNIVVQMAILHIEFAYW